MGTSSTLFNAGILQLNGTDVPDLLKDALASVLQDIGEDEDDVSRIPNPFAGWNGADAANPVCPSL